MATLSKQRADAGGTASVHRRTRLLAPAVVLCVDSVALLAAALVAGSAPLALVYAGLALVVLAASRAYRVPITPRASDEAPWVVARLAVALVLLTPIGFVIGGTDALVRGAALGIGLVVVGRVVSFAVVRRLRRSRVLSERTVIVGVGRIGVEIARALSEDRSYGAEPVGFVGSVSDNMPFPVLGDVDELDGIISRYDVRRVIIAFGPAHDAELVRALRRLVHHDVEVHVVPRFFDCGITSEGPVTDDVRGIPLYRVRCAASHAPTWRLKRLLDVLIAGSVLVLAAPIVGVVALAVRFSSPGPVLFRQRRVGKNGHMFEILKFRTLRHNDESDTQWSVNGDARLTSIGRFLRRTSLDELPQLWNVLRGDMALVGPRPERPFFVERFSAEVEGYDERHRLPVGVTGWAQVHGLRGDTSIEDRARFDNHYIENWSMWRDVVILGRTAAEVVRGSRGSDRRSDQNGHGEPSACVPPSRAQRGRRRLVKGRRRWDGEPVDG
jgi:exopolysaccharide biosynthesis polyprenyl glycosylphosphotransferase